MDQDPFRMFFQGRIAEYFQHPALVGVAFSIVDAAACVVEDAVHELVLLDEL